jgi:hypothetical protein
MKTSDPARCGPYVAVLACCCSGTTYIARAINALGLRVGHETLRADGTVDWRLLVTSVEDTDYTVPKMPGLLWAAHFWLDWNRRAMKKAGMTYRIEALPDVFDEFCARIGVEPKREVLSCIPTNVNSRAGRYKPISWQELGDLDSELCAEIAHLAWEFGYPAPPAVRKQPAR